MPLKIGFIGVGGIANEHLSHLSQMDGVEIGGMFDINRARAQQMAARYGGIENASVADMLDAGRPDAVYVCVPPFAHGDAEMAVVQRGIPLFVEKPLAIDLRTVEGILNAIEKKNLLSAVGYHWRYAQAVEFVRSALGNRVVGMVQGYWLGGMPMVPWWRKEDQSGGQMVEQTTHIVDLARHIAGEISEVYAAYALRQMHTEVEGVTAPDVGSVTLKFRNGAVGAVTNTCLLDQGYTVGLDVMTRDVIAEVRGDSATVRRRDETVTRRNGRSPYLVEDEAFIAAVRSGRADAIRSDYADAYQTHRVTDAARTSARTGEPVAL